MQRHEGPSDQSPCAARETALMPFARIYTLIRRVRLSLARLKWRWWKGPLILATRDDILWWEISNFGKKNCAVSPPSSPRLFKSRKSNV